MMMILGLFNDPVSTARLVNAERKESLEGSCRRLVQDNGEAEENCANLNGLRFEPDSSQM
jgi:hypothetical protein